MRTEISSLRSGFKGIAKGGIPVWLVPVMLLLASSGGPSRGADAPGSAPIASPGPPRPRQVLEAAASGGVIFVAPALEAPRPEAASCPGTIVFDNGAGTGLWQTAQNWSTDLLPGPSDDVCIPAGMNVTLGSGTQSIGTLFVESGASLAISGGSLAVVGASQVDGGFAFSGGTLTGAGEVTMNGAFTWTAGTMSGTGTTNANAGIAFSGASVKDIIGGRVLVTAGTSTWTGGQVRPGSGAVIRNGGVWDVQGDTSMVFLGGAPVQVVNQAGGTFRKSGGTGTLDINVPFNNDGTLSAQSGTVSLNAGGSGAGAFTGSPGATLAFSLGTYSLLAGSSLNASGVSVGSTAVLDVFGTYTVSTTTSVVGTARFNPTATLNSLGSGAVVNGILDLNSGEAIALTTLSITGSGASLRGSDTVTVSDPIVWTAGSMTGTGTTNANGGIAFSGVGVKDITGGRVLNTAGTTTWTGGQFRPGSGAVIRNSGLWDVQGDPTMAFLGGAPPLFVNQAGATFRKSSGTGVTGIAVAFDNAGAVSALSGTISLAGGGTGAGTFSASPGAGLAFDGGVYTLQAASTVDAPAVSVGFGTLTVTNGSSLSASTLSVGGSGTLDVFGSCTVTTSTSVTGTARFNPTATLNGLGTGVSLSGGILDLDSGESIALTSLSLTTGGASLRGSDTVTVSGPITWTIGSMTGTGTTNAQGGIVFSAASVKDITAGRVLNTSGTTTWTGGSFRPGSGAVIRNTGIWDVQGDTSMVFLGGAPALFINQAGATFRKSSGTGITSIGVAFDNAGAVSALSGTVGLAGGGTGTGTFTASPGAGLAFNGGTYTLQAGSTLDAPALSVGAGTLTAAGGSSLAASTLSVGSGATLDVFGTCTVTTSTSISGGTARFNSTATLNGLGTGASLTGVLDLNSGEAIALTSLSLTASAASLRGSDTVTVSGPLTWTAGSMTGTGTTNANGGIGFSGTGFKDITSGRVLNTAGTTTWTGGSVRPGSGAVIRNSGVWDVQGDMTLVFLGGAPPLFANQAGATFRKSAGTGTMNINVAFDNAGSLSILSGTVALNAGGAGAGTFSGSPGTALTFGGGSYSLLAGSSLDAPSVLVANGTVLDVSGIYAVSGSTTVAGAGAPGLARFNPAATVTSLGTQVTLSNGIIELNSGEPINLTSLSLSAYESILRGSDTVTVSSPIAWTGGQMTGTGTTNAQGGIAFSGASSVKDISGGRVLTTAGTTTWTGASVRLASGAVIRNSGVWDFQGDTTIAFLPGEAVLFDNLAGGTVRKTAGAGILALEVPFTNAGTLSVESGTVNLARGGSGAGTFLASPGATLAFNNATYTLSSGSTLDAARVLVGSGTLDVFGGFTVSATTTVSGLARFNPAATLNSLGSDVAISGGILELDSGEPIDMTTLSLASFGSILRGSDNVTVHGPITWTGGQMTGTGTTSALGGVLFSGTTSVKDIGGGRVLDTTGTTTWTGAPVQLATGAVIRNSGVWDVQGDTALNYLSGALPLFVNQATSTFRKSAGAGTAVVDVPFANVGTVRGLSGTLSFTDAYTQTAGSTAVEGGVISFAAPLDIQGGILGGSGTIAAAVTVAGRLAPGLPPGAPSPGALTIAGAYTQTAAGTYDVELGGVTPGAEHDTTAVSGLVALGGTLNVTLVNGFLPEDLDTFTILTFPSSSGTFATANLPVLGGDLVWKVHYNPTSIVLEVLDDLDGDGVRNLSDCRPSDPTVWAAPDEASGVTFTAAGQMSWSSLAAQAGPATVYDVVRGRISELPVGSGASETCLASGVPAGLVTDTSSPPPGAAYFYLVRGTNVCGVGTYGATSTGVPHVTAACP